MIVKKPNLLLISYTSLQSLPHNPAASSTSSRRSPHIHPRHNRAYATAGDATPDTQGSPSSPEADLWPASSNPRGVPSPYEILGCRRGAPYAKSRYYELVKLYHPDRHRHDHCTPPCLHSIPHHTRLERYRLIVAAHNLLSDPAKRSAYDRWGAGWNGFPEASSPHASGRSAGHSGGPGMHPMHNATWEDWEHYYHRHDGPQRPVYTSNGMFVALIAMAAMLGGVMQATRVDSWSTTIMERRDHIHHEASRELRRVKEAARGLNKEEKIQAFLRHRDATTYADEAYRRLLPNPETCDSGEVGKAET